MACERRRLRVLSRPGAAAARDLLLGQRASVDRGEEAVGRRLLLRRRDRFHGRRAGADVCVERARLVEQRTGRLGGRVLRLLSLLAVLGLGAGLAVAAAGGVPGLGEKSAALARLASVAPTDSNTTPAPVPRFAAHAIPARLLGSDVPTPVSPSLLRESNGWLVSDGKRLVAVYAGTASSSPAVGRIVIVRQDLVAGKQTVETLDAGPTGALTIVTAEAGGLRLRTADGRLLLLDLGKGKSHIVLTEPGYLDRPLANRTSESASHPSRRYPRCDRGEASYLESEGSARPERGLRARSAGRGVLQRPALRRGRVADPSRRPRARRGLGPP